MIVVFETSFLFSQGWNRKSGDPPKNSERQPTLSVIHFFVKNEDVISSHVILTYFGCLQWAQTLVENCGIWSIVVQNYLFPTPLAMASNGSLKESSPVAWWRLGHMPGFGQQSVSGPNEQHRHFDIIDAFHIASTSPPSCLLPLKGHILVRAFFSLGPGWSRPEPEPHPEGSYRNQPTVANMPHERELDVLGSHSYFLSCYSL